MEGGQVASPYVGVARALGRIAAKGASANVGLHSGRAEPAHPATPQPDAGVQSSRRRLWIKLEVSQRLPPAFITW